MESGRRGALDSIVEHLNIWRTFGALFALPRKKCVFLQVKSARRTFGHRATPSSPIVKPRLDVEIG